MSRRLIPCHLSRPIGICVAAPSVVLVASRPGAIYCVCRSVSHQHRPRQSSLQLERSLWALSNITRRVKKYLGRGDDYIALLEGSPSEGTSSKSDSCSHFLIIRCRRRVKGDTALETSVGNPGDIALVVQVMVGHLRAALQTADKGRESGLGRTRCTRCPRFAIAVSTLTGR
jgi:hypothetical protein